MVAAAHTQTHTHAHTLTECIESLSWWSWENLQQQHLISIFDFIGNTRTQTCKHILTHPHTHTHSHMASLRQTLCYSSEMKFPAGCLLTASCRYLRIAGASCMPRPLPVSIPSNTNVLNVLITRNDFLRRPLRRLWTGLKFPLASRLTFNTHSSNTAKAAGRR